MTQHHEVRLPKYLSAFLSSSTSFATSHITTKGGYDFIKLDNNFARRSFYLNNCRISLKQFEELQNFFKGRCGKLYSFRLQDLTDNNVTDQILGYGNNNCKEYKLIKTYHDIINPYNRLIKLPNLDTLEVRVNGEIETNYIFDSDKAMIIFNHPAPQDALITANFTFDVMARFNISELKYKFHPDGTILLDNFEIKEVI